MVEDSYQISKDVQSIGQKMAADNTEDQHLYEISVQVFMWRVLPGLCFFNLSCCLMMQRSVTFCQECLLGGATH